MKKRFLAILLAATMVFAMMPTMAFAAAADHAVKMVLVKDNTTFTGKEVLRVDFMYKSGTDTPMNQMVYLKVDEAVMGLLNANNGNAVTAAILSSFSTNRATAITKNNFEFESEELGMTATSEAIAYCVSNGGNTYLCWKITETKDATDVPALSDFSRISSMFFGLKDGVEFDAIPASAIKYSSPAEDYAITSGAQAVQITANGGAVNLEYNKRDGSADTMTTAPVIVAGDGVTFAKEAITGTATISGNTVVGSTLTAATTAPAGSTITWFSGSTQVATGTNTYTTKESDIGKAITVKVAHADYSGELTSNSITVTDKTLTGLTITSNPTKTEYVQGQAFVKDGLKVTATYDNGTENTNFTDYEISGFDSNTVGTQTLTVTAGGKTATFEVTVIAKVITGIEVTAEPSKKVYTIDEPFDNTGMVITATYNDNDKAPVAADSVDFSSAVASDSVTVTVHVGAFTDTFTVKVVKKPNAVTFTTPVSEVIAENEYSFAATATSGETVQFKYKAVGGEYSAAKPTAVGSYVVCAYVPGTTEYAAAEATHEFTIIARVVDSIAVKTNPTKLTYKQGAELDLAGLVVEATYNDGDKETVNNGDLAVSGYNAQTLGKQTITVKYAEKTATFEVTVTDLEAQTITFDSGDKNVTYGDGEFTNKATPVEGTEVYTSSNTGVVTVDSYGKVSIVGVGEATITATVARIDGKYAESTASYKVNVNPKAVTAVVTAASREYGAANPTFDFTVTGLVGSDTKASLNVILETAADTASAVGKYDVTGTYNNKNYTVTIEGTEKLTVTAKNVAKDNGTTELNVVKGVGTFAEPTFGEVTGTLAYSYDSATTYADVVTKLKALEKGATATVTYTFTAKGNYTGEITGTIEVTVVDIIFKVGDADATAANTLTVKADAVYGDTWADIVKKTGTVKAVVDVHEDADQSHFTLTPTGSPNAGENQAYQLVYNGTINGVTYTNIVVAEGTVNVAKKPITAPAQAGSVVYNGADQTYSVASTAEYTVTTPAGCKNVGEYNVTIALTDKANTMWADGTDADLTHKLTITKAALTVKADDVQLKINGELPASYTYTVTGLKGTDALTATVAVKDGATPDVTKAGEYVLVASGAAFTAGSADNYEITYVDGTLSIKNNIVVIPVAPKPDEDEPVEPEKPVVPVIGGVFTDVKADDWFAGAVEYVYENGLMDGMGNNQFAPYGTTTRGQIVTILWRLEGKPLPSITNPFSDVGYSEWYSTAITWAAEHKIVNGVTTTTFDPTAPITREQIAAILYRYAQYKGYDTSAAADLGTYADAASVSGYAVNAMKWACGTGLINGIDGALAPTGTAIRCQAATLLMRFCENVAK